MALALRGLRAWLWPGVGQGPVHCAVLTGCGHAWTEAVCILPLFLVAALPWAAAVGGVRPYSAGRGFTCCAALTGCSPQWAEALHALQPCPVVALL